MIPSVFSAPWASCFGLAHACRPAKYGPIKTFSTILNLNYKIILGLFNAKSLGANIGIVGICPAAKIFDNFFSILGLNSNF